MADQMQTIPVPEDIWVLFRETGRRMQETDNEIKELKKQIGKLGNRFGELVEHLVAPNIAEKFNALGYHFEGYASDTWFKENGRVIAEIDILLENSDFIVAVEVKSKPLADDVKEHITRLENLRRYKDRHHDSRKIHGAIAGAIMPAGVREYARRTGFYVIEQTGDTVSIEIPEGFKPREW
jgi:hypothetical protein